jgi:hypothetical protein
MALKPQEAYLHLLTGGFDNNKRRQIRKLFASTPISEGDEMDGEHDLDLVVGLLEEFYSIGVKEFNLRQAQQAFEIFGIVIFDDNDLCHMLCSPRLRLHASKDTWAVPDERHIENLKVKFCDCSEEAIAKRSVSIRTATIC